MLDLGLTQLSDKLVYLNTSSTILEHFRSPLSVLSLVLHRRMNGFSNPILHSCILQRAAGTFRIDSDSKARMPSRMTTIEYSYVTEARPCSCLHSLALSTMKRDVHLSALPLAQSQSASFSPLQYRSRLPFLAHPGAPP